MNGATENDMNTLVYLMASGLAAFWGLGLMAGAVAVAGAGPRWLARWGAALLTFVGGALVAVSSTPWPVWLYAVAVVWGLVWLVSERRLNGPASRRLWGIRTAQLGLLALLAAIELPWHFVPALPAASATTLIVLGDSLSAGVGGERTRWPDRVGEILSVKVHNLAQAGATVGSARRQAERLEGLKGLVLVELGGNDVFGSTTAAEFETRLAALLEQAQAPARSIVMLELPLPPFCQAYAAAQRRVARRAGVPLVPKRYLAHVLTTPGATTDGLHFSPSGHTLLADSLAIILKPAFERLP